MAKDNSTIVIVVMVVLALLFFQNAELFGINLQSQQIQYSNEPIKARFTTTEFTQPSSSCVFPDCGPNIQTFFDGEELFYLDPSNDTILEVSVDVINDTYVVVLDNVIEEGVFKIVVTEGNLSETVVIEVRKPFVDVEHNIINLIDKGGSETIQIRTFDPQGNELEADSVDIDVIAPTDITTNIVLDKKGGNIFEVVFNYEEAGNYLYKIHARKDGFEIQEVTAITNVIKSQGIHPIIWVWGIFIVVWLTLFGIRRIRR